MLRCNRCGATWVTHWSSRSEKEDLLKKHDIECPALPVGGETDG